jgi:3-oxoacyl-[acyl-carrier protein] reductase
MSLDGKVALVTGGSRGIGAAVVRRLAEEGAAVAFSYAASAQRADELADELTRAGHRVAAYKSDQADPAQARALVESVVADFGGLDILVNNAGVAGGGSVADADADIEEMDQTVKVNLLGVLATVRAAGPVLRDNGRVITIGSVAALRSFAAGRSDYTGTKAAVAGYAKGWARDLGARGITVNTVQPGPIATDMLASAARELIDEATKDSPLGRLGQPEEVAALVAFLAGPEAGYISASTINIDGALTA